MKKSLLIRKLCHSTKYQFLTIRLKSWIIYITMRILYGNFRQNTTFDVEFYTNLNYFNSVRQLSLWEHKLLQLNSWQPDTFLYIMKWIGTLTLLRFYYRCHLFKPQKQLFYIPSHSCQAGSGLQECVCVSVCVCVHTCAILSSYYISEFFS